MRARSAESRVALCALAVSLLYAFFVLAVGKVELNGFLELWRLYLVSSYLLLGLVLAPATILLMRKEIVAAKAEKRALIGPTRLVINWFVYQYEHDRLIMLLTPPFVLATVVSAYNGFKEIVLSHVPFRYDALFEAADRSFFLGHDPWRVTHAVFSQPWMTMVMDFAYYAWFVPMALCIVACSVLPRARYVLQAQYIFTYMFVWIGLGSIAAWLLPAAGPCFYNDYVGHSANYAALMSHLHAIDQSLGGDVIEALNKQEYLRSSFNDRVLAIGGGISAMPSVHNALATLFALAASSVSRRFGWLAVLYAGLIWIGSIHLGWHYAIDGIVSILLTCLVWSATGRVARLMGTPSPTIAEPALA